MVQGQRYHALPQHGAAVDSGKPRQLTRTFANQDLQFAVHEMRDAKTGKHKFTAKAGDEVVIEISSQQQKPMTVIQAGDLLHKVRSADLRRRVEAVAKPTERVCPEIHVGLQIASTFDQGLVYDAVLHVELHGHSLPPIGFILPENSLLNTKPSASCWWEQLHRCGPLPEEADRRFLQLDSLQVAPHLQQLSSLR